MFQRYKNLDYAVLCQSLYTEGGDWRSIYSWAKHLELSGQRIGLVKPSSPKGLRQILAIATFSPKVIVNGLSTLNAWSILMICIFRRDIAIYLHETEYILDEFQKTHPIRYHFLSKILQKNPILCVSNQAMGLYRSRWGATNTHLVYECISDAPSELKLSPEKAHIVMVGSINARKGVDLFSQVADLAEKMGKAWEFHWLGNLATQDPFYKSNRVNWHGWQWQPASILEQCDLFFLSSIDDPCPLAALEAMNQGLRVVVYKHTGIAEIVNDVKGCAIYRTYDAQAGLYAIEKALEDSNCAEHIRARSQKISSLQAFSKRMKAVL